MTGIYLLYHKYLCIVFTKVAAEGACFFPLIIKGTNED